MANFEIHTISGSVGDLTDPPFTDVLLATVVLTEPRDGYADYKLVGQVFSPKVITMRWTASPGADFYVVQWCQNSAFRGPTLRGRKTSNLYLQLTEDAKGELERTSDERWYYWRVFAYKK